MTSPTVIALTGFLSWALALLIVMEVIRSKMVLLKEIPANGFVPDNSNLSPFMHRLARAHANCVEGIPIFGGLMFVAIATEQTAVTDSLAYVFLGARVVQSLIHLASTSATAVTLRFTAFSVQMITGAFWAYRLLSMAI